MRSPTAADICASWDGIETDFAGLSNDADERLSSEQLAWADIVFVMERRQKVKLGSVMGTQMKGLRVRCLDIPDKYGYMQPELVEILEQKLRAFF